MQPKPLLMVFMFLCFTTLSLAQHDHGGILKTILTQYYKSEKPVVKGRAQFLFLFCDRAKNNEELFETINALKLPVAEAKALKNQVLSGGAQRNWATELEAAFSDNKTLQAKVNACLSLEEYQEKQKKSAFNNQRLLIISEPIFYQDGKTALVKIVFYRNIEHNSGSVLLMQKKGDVWEIASFLNPWET